MLNVTAPHPHSPETSRPLTSRRLIGSLGVIAALCGMGTAKAATAPAVNLAWNAVPEAGIQGYRIYAGTLNNPFSRTYDTGTTTSFSVGDLEAGQTYHFAVSAIGSTGLESDLSDEITVSLPLPPPPVSAPLPVNWAGTDIGPVRVAGSSGQNGGVYTVSGGGADIWGSSDEFQFATTTLTGDGEIRARVTSQTNTDTWAKAGVMIRNGTAANAEYAMMLVTPNDGFGFQYRTVTGADSGSTPSPSLNAIPDNWVRITRCGNLLTSYCSADGNTWTQVGQVTIAMESTVNVGLAVTSHNNNVTSTATFDNVAITTYPLPWMTADIGSPGLAGRTEFFNNIHTVSGAGTLGGTTDGFRYVYQTLSGDGSIVARINDLQNTGANARVGVMIRDTLASNSRMASLAVTGSGTWNWQRRTTVGGNVSTTTSSAGTAPNLWVKITRKGNKFTASRSTNGSTWTTINTTTITMASNCYIGLMVASGSQTTLNSSQFSNLNVAL